MNSFPFLPCSFLHFLSLGGDIVPRHWSGKVRGHPHRHWIWLGTYYSVRTVTCLYRSGICRNQRLDNNSYCGDERLFFSSLLRSSLFLSLTPCLFSSQLLPFYFLSYTLLLSSTPPPFLILRFHFLRQTTTWARPKSTGKFTFFLCFYLFSFLSSFFLLSVFLSFVSSYSLYLILLHFTLFYTISFILSHLISFYFILLNSVWFYSI